MSAGLLGACLALLLAQTAGPPLVLNTAFTEPVSTARQDGIFDRVAQEAFRRVGRSVQIQQLAAQRGLINANAGIDDGDGPRVGGLAKLSAVAANLVQVPESVLTVEFVALTRDPEIVVDTWAQLAPYDVAVIRGWKIVERNITHSRSLVAVRSVDLLLGMLARRRADVVVVGRHVGLAAAARHGLSDVRVAGRPLVTREMFLYLHRKHAALVPRLADALRAMKRDGTFATLSQPPQSAP